MKNFMFKIIIVISVVFMLDSCARIYHLENFELIENDDWGYLKGDAWSGDRYFYHIENTYLRFYLGTPYKTILEGFPFPFIPVFRKEGTNPSYLSIAIKSNDSLVFDSAITKIITHDSVYLPYKEQYFNGEFIGCFKSFYKYYSKGGKIWGNDLVFKSEDYLKYPQDTFNLTIRYCNKHFIDFFKYDSIRIQIDSVLLNNKYISIVTPYLVRKRSWHYGLFWTGH